MEMSWKTELAKLPKTLWGLFFMVCFAFPAILASYAWRWWVGGWRIGRLFFEQQEWD